MNDETQKPANARGNSDWFCEKCGNRNEPQATRCQTCNEVGNEINTPADGWGSLQPPSDKDLRRGRIITRFIALVVLVCVAAAGYLGYLGYKQTRIDSLSEQAYQQHSDKKFEDAAKTYSEILEYDPNYVWALANRAGVYHTLFEHEKALQDFNRVIRLDPNFEGIFLSRGALHEDIGRLKNALADYQIGQIKDGTNYELVARIMHVRYFLGDLDQTLKDADYLSSKEQEPGMRNFARANVYFERGEYDRALLYAKHSVSASPEDAYAQVQLAEILAEIDLKGAESAWNKSLKLGPDDPYIIAAYGYYKLQCKQPADAHYQKILTLPIQNSADAFAHFEAYCTLGQVKEAEQIAPKLERFSQESRWAQAGLASGYCLLARKSESDAKKRYHERALDHLEKAFALGLHQWKGFSDDWLLSDLKTHPSYQKLIAAP